MLFLWISLTQNLHRKTPYRLKFLFRSVLRRLLINTTSRMLTCGHTGVTSAATLGFQKQDIISFPYYISAERILSDKPENLPESACLKDLKLKQQILFFSGRMIDRKGWSFFYMRLLTFLPNTNWTLWIEGDGPRVG